jgi:two-component system sensor histidine kinase BaeS
MRSPLFRKLFALQLLAALALILVALAVMRLNAAHSFSAYLEAQQSEHLHDSAQRFAYAYRQNPDLLDAARHLPELRDSSAAPGGESIGGPPPADAPGMPGMGLPPPGMPPPRVPPPGMPFGAPPYPIQAGALQPPLQLLDLHGAIVAGSRRPIPADDALREPVSVDGSVVAYLQQPRRGGRNTAAEDGFARQQLRGLLFTAGLSIVLAALTAALMSLLLLRPVRRLSQGTAALARREFGTRLEIRGDDELGRLAQDFNRLGESLQHYETQQKQWLADVAHELRTPLAVLRGELEALLDGVRQADVPGIRSLHQEVQRLASLVDDLHLLSLADSGGLELCPHAVDAAALVRETVSRFDGRFSAAGFTLLTGGAAGPLPMQADERRIEQVLANLLQNALRYARPPGPVTVGAQCLDGDVSLAVSDSGPGVPDAARPRLFDRLYRVDASRSREHGGSGLGLAICRSIVEAHGGRILARRSQAGGLEVELVLPAAGPPTSVRDSQT